MSDPNLKPLADTLAALCPCAQRDALRSAAGLLDKPFRCGFDLRGAMGIEHEIKKAVRWIVNDEDNFGILSTGEQIAVALVLNRFELLGTSYTILSAVDRLGADWFAAALQVQRDGWE